MKRFTRFSARLMVALLAAKVTSLVAQTNALNATGNVGVGTTSPTRPLSVVGDMDVRNNAASAVGTHFVAVTSGTTPSLYFTRSNQAWSDNWWQWTMGTDNKLRLGFSSVPQVTFQNGRVGVFTDAPESGLHVGEGGCLAAT